MYYVVRKRVLFRTERFMFIDFDIDLQKKFSEMFKS